MKLKQLLNDHGITQTELARLLGRDKSVITNLLQGRRRLKADEAAIISQVLNVPVAEILGLDEAAAAGVAETCLIPFQHAPIAGAGKQIIEKDGKFFLEESGAFSARAYAVEVRDASMNLSGVLPGDIVISEDGAPLPR